MLSHGITVFTTGYGENRDFTAFAAIVKGKLQHISNGNVIVYTDFARHVGPIVCALNDDDIKAVGYYGTMNDKDKEESHRSWQDGHVTVMVATRAFGLGINKKNIRLVIRHGLPPDLSSWVQEFGRAGRDGLPAAACIVYSEDDIQHLCYWLGGDKQRDSTIAAAFSKALTFSYAHLARKCRHEVVLEGFGEQMQISQNADHCCDVCALPQVSPDNRLHELSLMVNAIDEIGTKGEKKFAQFIRGSNEAWIKNLPNFDPSSSSTAYGKSPPNLSLEWWRQFARQCSVAGYLVRKVDCGTFQGRQAAVFSYYAVTQEGRDAVVNSKEVLLPPIPNQAECILSTQKSLQGCSNEKGNEKKKRVGRGSNPLSIAKALMVSQDSWREITSKEQYQFPGVSTSGQSNILLYSKDISKLPQYVASKPHFLWEDIQLSKGKLNPDRAVTLHINGKDETVFYRTAPCNGVKVCSAPNCCHVQPLNSKKNMCTKHPNTSTHNTSNCPVVFMYFFHQNFPDDNRRYISSYVVNMLITL